MKKANRPQQDKNSDRIRLMAMTKDTYDETWSNDGKTHPEHVCGYVLGFYLEFNLEQRKILVEEYQKGDLVYRREMSF